MVEVLCYNAMFDEQYFNKQMLRLYQELLWSTMLYENFLRKSDESIGKEVRKNIEENSDLLLLSGESCSTDPVKHYIRGSFESLIVLTLADYLEGGRNDMILKRIEEYRQHSSHNQELFNKRASLLLSLLNQSVPELGMEKMHAE